MTCHSIARVDIHDPVGCARCLDGTAPRPPAALRAAGVELGTTYLRPVVDLAASRQGALAAYAESRGRG